MSRKCKEWPTYEYESIRPDPTKPFRSDRGDEIMDRILRRIYRDCIKSNQK